MNTANPVAIVREPITPRQFTVDEFHRMADAGIFRDSEHLELLDGRLYGIYADEPRTFTAEKYHRLAEIGILDPAERVELVEGTLYVMSPIGSRHSGTLDYLADGLRNRLGPRAIVRSQNPLLLPGGSDLQPDIAVVRPRDDYYRGEHPRPADVFLVIEIMETSAAYDRGVKQAAYARAGIPEVWLVDLRGDVIEVHRGPVSGVYSSCSARGRGEIVSPDASPDIALEVNDLLG